MFCLWTFEPPNVANAHCALLQQVADKRRSVTLLAKLPLAATVSIEERAQPMWRGMNIGALFALLVAAGVVAGCAANPIQATVFAQPTITNKAGNSVEVTYYNSGIMAANNEATAMDMLKRECGGQFRIVNRSATPQGDSYVSAECMR
jgi:hypothetical protein